MKTHGVTEVLHYPRLDTVLMVENTIRTAKEYPNKMQLWKALPKSMMYQTFELILDYLETSGKIAISAGKVFWIWDPNAISTIKNKGLIVT